MNKLLLLVIITFFFGGATFAQAPISSGQLERLCKEEGPRPELGKEDPCRQFMSDEELEREKAAEYNEMKKNTTKRIDIKRAIKEIADQAGKGDAGPWLSLKKFKAISDGSLFLCQLIELRVHLQKQIYFITQKQEMLDESIKTVREVRECGLESEKTIRPFYNKARGELQKQPRAEEKLKSFMGAWLGILRSMPRDYPSESSARRQQQIDKALLESKHGEIDAELF